jgi:hypothetical protein
MAEFSCSYQSCDTNSIHWLMVFYWALPTTRWWWSDWGCCDMWLISI